LHQALRDTCRFFADLGIDAFAGQSTRKALTQGEQAAAAPAWLWHAKMCAKYFIDAICYPVLLASTRSIVLRNDPRSTLECLDVWCKEEGHLSLWSGMAAHMLSTAVDEAMEMYFSNQLDKASAGSEIEMADKVLLKVSFSSVSTILTGQINYVSTIQKCTSMLPGMLAAGMLAPAPLGDTLQSLPWRSSIQQFVLFGGIFALNARLIKWKIEMQAEDERNGPD